MLVNVPVDQPGAFVPPWSRTAADRHSATPILVAASVAVVLHVALAIALGSIDWKPQRPPEFSSLGDATIAFELLPNSAEPSSPTEESAQAKPQPKILPSEPIPEPLPPMTPAKPIEPPAAQIEPEPARKDPLADLEPDRRPTKLDPLDMPSQRRVSAADILASRNQELANLMHSQQAAYSGAATKRRKAINASTREYVYANYLESWRLKVERIGNLNYPEEAKEKRLYGSLVLHVAVRSDGTLEGVWVLRSSGHAVLDQAAVRIVELAAPFAPFPPSISARHDVLDITRTWQFERDQRLGWGK